MPSIVLDHPAPPAFTPWESKVDNSKIPRWLFRSWSPGSNGQNSSTIFMSPATENGKLKQTLDQFEGEEKRNTVASHVRWENRGSDPLISFTSSIIFALQHGIYKIASPRDPADTSLNGHLTIMDTRGIESAFKPMLDLFRENRLDQSTDQKLWSGWYTHEYAAQNVLIHSRRSVTFSFQQLAEAGLFRIYREFQDLDWLSKLAARWMDLTTGPWHDSPWLASEEELTVVQCLLNVIDSRWHLMVAINILSIKARSPYDRRLPSFLLPHLKAADNTFANAGGFDHNSIPCVEMQNAYKLMKVLSAIRLGVAGLGMLQASLEIDAADTAEEALEWLVQDAKTGFEPKQMQTTGDSYLLSVKPLSAAGAFQVASGTSSLVLSEKSSALAQLSAGLITPPTSRNNSIRSDLNT